MSTHAENAGARRTIVGVLSVLGVLLIAVLAAWPVLTDAQDGSGPPGVEMSTTTDPDDGSDADATTEAVGAPPGDEVPEATVPDDGSPSMVFVDSSLEVAPDGEFGTVVEVKGAPAGSDLAVQIYDRVTTVEQLEASASEVPANLLATFDTLPLAAAEPPDTQLSSFVISLYTSGQPRPPDAGAWAYRLDEPGVYPVRVRLRGPEGEQLDSFVVYLARTAGGAAADPEGGEGSGSVPGPGSGDGAGPAVQVALLARIHEDPPVHDSDSTPASIAAQPLEAAPLTAIDGFVTALTDRAQLPLTFSVTPDTARRMAEDPASRPTADRIRAALVDDDREVLSAPYADIDAAAVVGQGLEGELDAQMILGYQHLEQAVGQSGNGTWLVDHPIDLPTVDSLVARSVTGLVVDPGVLAEDRHAPVLLDGTESTLTAVPLFDSGLTESQTSSGGDPNDRLAAHHAVGRLAALRGVEPGGAAVAVEIDPDIDAERLAPFLDLVETAPDHLQLTTVDRILDEAPAPVLTALAGPVATGDDDLAREIRSTRSRVDSYRSMLAEDSPTLQMFDLPLAVTLSAHRSDDDRRADLAAIESMVERRFASVVSPARDRVTLGTRDATFPLPISTDSDEPLRVRIDVQASDRVELPRSSFEADLTGERTVVQIPVRALASGDTTLVITVRTPDGEVVLTQSRYTVRSTVVSGVGVVLTVGAGGFLAVWWGRHWYRTRKDRRTEAGSARHGSDDLTPV